jgi:hypothetical protein
MQVTQRKSGVNTVVSQILLAVSIGILTWGCGVEDGWKWWLAVATMLGLVAVALSGRGFTFGYRLGRLSIMQGQVEKLESIARVSRSVRRGEDFTYVWLILANTASPLFLVIFLRLGQPFACVPIVCLWVGTLSMIWNWYRTTAVLLGEFEHPIDRSGNNA